MKRYLILTLEIGEYNNLHFSGAQNENGFKESCEYTVISQS